jgi:hypothetical protein
MPYFPASCGRRLDRVVPKTPLGDIPVEEASERSIGRSAYGASMRL